MSSLLDSLKLYFDTYVFPVHLCGVSYRLLYAPPCHPTISLPWKIPSRIILCHVLSSTYRRWVEHASKQCGRGFDSWDLQDLTVEVSGITASAVTLILTCTSFLSLHSFLPGAPLTMLKPSASFYSPFVFTPSLLHKLSLLHSLSPLIECRQYYDVSIIPTETETENHFPNQWVYLSLHLELF